jgi:hypothetical protein
LKRRVEIPESVVAASPPTASPAPITLPLGECADALYQLRERRLQLQRELDGLTAEETRYREHLVAALEHQGLTAVAGQTCRAGLTETKIGHVTDWAALEEYIIVTGDFSLLQRRANDAALRERWAEGETVPGVEPFAVTKVSLTKAH